MRRLSQDHQRLPKRVGRRPLRQHPLGRRNRPPPCRPRPRRNPPDPQGRADPRHSVTTSATGAEQILSKTWRMHPELCSFVSAAVYEGKLQSEPGCATQRLALAAGSHSALKSASLSFVPVEHKGCRQKSEDEATVICEILASLLGQRVVDRRGDKRAMTLEDVLIVAPYNMQVNHLRSVLPEGARVGTVDKFQGQEAEAVIVSMATSGADDMPRDTSFLLSRNRLNVAISRARCLAVLVASPALLNLVATSVEEMRLANLFCWAADYSSGTPSQFSFR
ncbi:MAG: ATP-binding domain-containing protein [Blastochloris sp.]|nr:ATP-binding domain-containing protein [Blastochloris sp.]